MKTLINFFKVLFSGGTQERPSPSDITPSENTYVMGTVVFTDYGKKLYIPFTRPPRVFVSEVPDSNSMDAESPAAEGFDAGHILAYIEPADEENHQIMCDWLAKEFEEGKKSNWKSGGANDCVYRMMVNPEDNPYDFTKPNIAGQYAIHRISAVKSDAGGRYWEFHGINNPIPDGAKVRDRNILWLLAEIKR